MNIINSKFKLMMYIIVFSSIFHVCFLNLGKTEEINEIVPSVGINQSLLHPIINISSNGELNTFSNKTGNGTAGNPFIIENLEINAGGNGPCIKISNTDVFLTIRNCTTQYALSFNGIGILLANCSNVNITGCFMSNNHLGISLDNCTNITVQSNNISNGINIIQSNGTAVINNDISGDFGWGMFLFDSEDNIISGNNVSNSHISGIYSMNSSENTYSGNTVFNNANSGFLFENCSNSTISGNVITNCYTGILLEGVSNTSIVDNNISLGTTGILLRQSSESQISGNNMLECGVWMYGDDLNLVSSHIINQNNTVNGGMLYYYVSENALDSANFSSAGQVILVNCTNSSLSGMNLSHGSVGASLYYSTGINIIGNDFSNNYIGLYAFRSNITNISGNNASLSDGKGIELQDCTRGEISFNDVMNSIGEEGIYINQMSDANISYNNLGGNIYGLHMWNTSNSTIRGNNASFNGQGISLWFSDNNTVWENNASFNSNGDISISTSENNSLSSNIMNHGGLHIDSYQLNQIDTSNMVNGRIIYYYINETGLVPDNFTNAGQIILINCDGAVITGLNLSYTYTGIKIINSDNVDISETNASSNVYYGIIISSCNNVNISNCDASYNRYYGIGIRFTKNASITNNSAKDNRYGIYMFIASYCNITGNNASNNLQGIYIRTSEYLMVENNDVWDCDIFGIFSSISNQTTISGNNIHNGADGIRVIYTNNYNISKNNVSLNRNNGIYVSSSNNCSIKRNYVWRNENDGVCLTDSNGTQIIGNNVSFNGAYGIRFWNGCTSNLVYLNTFIKNDWSEAFDENGGNSWDNGSLGNYWGDYKTLYPNATNDGMVWNQSYTINGSFPIEQDNFPLAYYGMEPIVDFTFNPMVVVGELIEFTAGWIDLYDIVVSWQWNFGDGSENSSQLNPSHVYSTSGTFTVTLTVYDDAGESSTISKNIVVMMGEEVPHLPLVPLFMLSFLVVLAVLAKKLAVARKWGRKYR